MLAEEDKMDYEIALSKTLEEFTKVVEVNTAVINAQNETIANLLEACETTLELLNHMTTDQYSKGHDKQARRTLKQASAAARN